MKDKIREVIRYKFSTGLYSKQGLAEHYNLPLKEIEKILRRPRGRPRKPFNYEKALEMRLRGSSDGEIAKELGVSRTTVSRRLRQ